jgi:hypothetical protein
VVENLVIVELKCVDAFQPIHEAQLITYLKLSRIDYGLLIDFNSRLLRSGIKRITVANRSTRILVALGLAFVQLRSPAEAVESTASTRQPDTVGW